jgi:hypothetical protein
MFSYSSSQAQEELEGLAIQIPSLLERIDALSGAPTPATRDLECLRQDYLDVLQSFDAWLQRHNEVQPERTYWSVDGDSDDPPPTAVFDWYCQPSFPNQTYRLRFRDGATAGRFARYWSFRLELLDGMAKLYRLVPLRSGAWLPHNGNAEELTMETDQLARMTLEAINYLQSCLEGVVAAYGPWGIVKRYSERKQLNSGYQLKLNAEVPLDGTKSDI